MNFVGNWLDSAGETFIIEGTVGSKLQMRSIETFSLKYLLKPYQQNKGRVKTPNEEYRN